VNPASVDAAVFEPHTAIEVDPTEPAAANVLRIGSIIICASAYERTNARLESAGHRLRRLDMSELAKAEGGVTCCSLVFHG
jgi:dimethylargininase